jgi:hypothetical protein
MRSGHQYLSTNKVTFMKTFKVIPAILVSGLLTACGGSDKGAELPPPSVLSSSSAVSSSSVASSSSPASSSADSSSSAPALDVAWNIFDGNASPFASGVVVLADGSNTEFTLGGNADGLGADYFTVVGDGTLDFDTSADETHQHYAQINGVVANDGVYPKYLTLLAGITGPSVSSRVLDIEIALADEGAAGSRLKAVLRADDSSTGVQLERAIEGGATPETSVTSYGLDMLDVFRVYHIAIELTSATHGNVRVYADGGDETLPNLNLENVEMRPTSGDGNNFLRFGDAGGSAYQANIDWFIWTNEAAYTPAELANALPADIGCINGYGAVSCGGASSSSSSSSSPDLTADFEFEDDPLLQVPTGFTASGAVYVSDVQARMGSRSIQMTRLNSGENVNFRRTIGATPTGNFNVSVFVPENIQESTDIYITLFAGGNSVSNNRVAEVILQPGGAVRNRAPGNVQETIEDVTYNHGSWNDFALSWASIDTSGEYTLTLNGQSLGVLPAEHMDRIPDRFEIKMGSGASPVSPEVSIFVDSVTAF